MHVKRDCSFKRVKIKPHSSSLSGQNSSGIVIRDLVNSDGLTHLIKTLVNLNPCHLNVCQPELVHTRLNS